jgi:hypothetical protein
VCQDQLIEAARAVETALGQLMSKSKLGCNDATEMAKLTAAAERVTMAIGRLVDKTRQGGQKDADLSDVDRSAEQVLGDAQTFIDSIGDLNAVLGAARTLAVSATHMVNTIKNQAAGETDGVEKARLLAAARVLAEATARMVNAAKVCPRPPTPPPPYRANAGAAVHRLTERLFAGIEPRTQRAGRRGPAAAGGRGRGDGHPPGDWRRQPPQVVQEARPGGQARRGCVDPADLGGQGVLRLQP